MRTLIIVLVVLMLIFFQLLILPLILLRMIAPNFLKNIINAWIKNIAFSILNDTMNILDGVGLNDLARILENVIHQKF